jgi:acid phosphatase type 7
MRSELSQTAASDKLRIVRPTILFVLLVACSSNEPAVTPADSEGEVDEEDTLPKCDLVVSKGPWVVAVDATSAKVRWESCKSGGGAITIAGKKHDSVVREAVVTTTNLAPLRPGSVDAPGTYFMHEVALTGLMPATCFDYEIDPVNKGRFCTARNSGDEFKLAIIGDTNPGFGNIDKMLATAYGDKPDFTIHQGDIQYYESGLETYGFWMEKMRPMLRTGAFYPSIGNHETEQPKEREEYVERFFGKPGFDGNSDYYRFQSGGVWFFALDTERDDFSDKGAQGVWLKEKLEDAAKQPGYRFSVLYMHRPFVTCGDKSQNGSLRAQWLPMFQANKVKLVVGGHMHGYERFEFDGITWVTSGGGGGALGKIDENKDRAECVNRKASGAFWNATVITVKPTEISGVTYDDKGASRDTFSQPL